MFKPLKLGIACYNTSYNLGIAKSFSNIGITNIQLGIPKNPYDSPYNSEVCRVGVCIEVTTGESLFVCL
jgi:hypothetical protein